MFVFEAKVFQFCFDTVQSQTVGKRCIDVECFSGNFVLFARKHGAQCTHVVQAVGYLDKNHPDVIVHGKQQLLEVFCLSRCTVTKNSSGYFSQSVYNLGYFAAKQVFDIFYGIVGIFYHIVQEGRTYRRRA